MSKDTITTDHQRQLDDAEAKMVWAHLALDAIEGPLATRHIRAARSHLASAVWRLQLARLRREKRLKAKR